MENSIMEGTGILYHVTLAEHENSIDAEGIGPQYATGKLKVSWYVRKSEILWAIVHTSIRHNTPAREIVVCACMIDWKHMKRTAWAGRYYTYHTYHPESFTPAEWFDQA